MKNIDQIKNGVGATLAFVLVLLGGCEKSSESADSSAAKSEDDAARKRLEGRWIMRQEFGGGDCKNLDCAGKVEGDGRALVFEAEKFTRTYPEAPSQTGRWTLESRDGDTLSIEMAVQLDDMKLPPSSYTIEFRGDDELELRRDDRHGGIYRRAAD